MAPNQPGMGGYPPNPLHQRGQPGAYPPQANPYAQMGLGQYVVPGQTGMPPQTQPFPQPVQPSPQGNPPQQFGGSTPFPTPGGPQPGQGGNQAVQLIQGLLTQPRPGGLQGMQGAAGGMAGIPGGIAGVASTKEANGIMVYNEKSKYNEWEFLYDMQKEQQKAAGPVPDNSNPLQKDRPPQVPPNPMGGTR
jgi:hypothetical protein